MNRKETFAPDEYYHLHNRGVEKRSIYKNDSDKIRFMSLLFLCNTSRPVDWRAIENIWSFERENTLIDIGCYCLMSNHFHLLVKEKTENGISRFMQKLQTAYSMYFNIKYKRSGSLFKGKFSSHHVDSDQYFNYLYSYIHLNPLKLHGLSIFKDKVNKIKSEKKFLENYKFSSYADYANFGQGKRIENVIINPSAFPQYFESKKDFDWFITDWIEIRNEADDFLFTKVRPS
ncbi:MAG: transposase [Patescibacteria group bacterium]